MADITIVNGVYKPTNITGGYYPVCNLKFWEPSIAHADLTVDCHVNSPFFASPVCLFQETCHCNKQAGIFLIGL